jgi:hypothetical protein
VVSAVDSFGESANSAQVTATLFDPGFQLSATPSSQIVSAGNGTNYTVMMSTNGNFSGTVVFGIGGLPSAASASFSPPSLGQGGSSLLTIQTTTNTPGGAYVLTIAGTNGASVLTTNVTFVVNGTSAGPGTLLWTSGSGAGTNWSAFLNWTNVTAGGYGPPGAGNSVVFTNTATAAAQAAVDNVVDSSVAIASLLYSHTNHFHNTLILPGDTLSIATNLTVGTGTDLGTSGAVFASISGGGGSLVITNTNCVVNIRQGTGSSSGPYLQRATLDMSGLDTFNAKANRILIAADGGVTSRETGTLYLAKTNIITLYGSAPAIDAGENPSNGAGANNDPSALTSFLYLGQSNGIFADSIGIGRSKGAGVMAFNPAYTNGLTPALYLRGATANRVATFSLGDESPLGSSNQRSTGTADFSGGTVDALIDTAYIGRSINGTNTGTAVSAAGTLTFDVGTINANTLEIGFQTLAIGTGPGASGTVNVNGDGVLIVNQTIELAHGSVSSPPVQGVLNINGGTVQATNINGGGGLSAIALNSGKLDLQSGGIANVSALNVGASSVSEPALLANAGSITSSNAIVIAPNGTLAGNAVIAAPGLTVNGVISPGVNGAGWITNNGPVTFGAGGSYVVTVQNGVAGPANGWSFLKASAGIVIQATSGSPFGIQLQSAGLAANFGYNTNYDWVIATANGGIANYDPPKFTVDDSLFANDLAGGYFYIRTNSDASALVLSFTNNHPPVAAPVSLTRTETVMTIPLASLAAHWSDPDGDPVALVSVNQSSPGGANNVSTDGAYIYYTNANNVLDTISYTVQDARTNPPAVYRPGDTVQAVAGTLTILPARPLIAIPAIQGGNLVLSGSGGLPNRTYYVLTATNMALPLDQWLRIATNQFDAAGDFQFTNSPALNASQQFFLLQSQ